MPNPNPDPNPGPHLYPNPNPQVKAVLDALPISLKLLPVPTYVILIDNAGTVGVGGSSIAPCRYVRGCRRGLPPEAHAWGCSLGHIGLQPGSHRVAA